MKDIRKPISWGRPTPFSKGTMAKELAPVRSRGEYEPVSRSILAQVAAILLHPLPRPICQACKTLLDIRRTQNFLDRNIFFPPQIVHLSRPLLPDDARQNRSSAANLSSPRITRLSLSFSVSFQRYKQKGKSFGEIRVKFLDVQIQFFFQSCIRSICIKL